MPKYTLSEQDESRLSNNFVYHAPFGDQLERYQSIRNMFGMVARHMMENCPKSRELSDALTSLEHAMYQANAAIARNEKQDVV